MINPTYPIDNPDVASLTDDEILDILRRVQAGELSAEQAEQLLSAAGEREAPEPAEAARDSQNFSAPLGKTANGKLIFARGVAGLTLRGERLPGQLFTAHFERHVPIVRINGGAITVRYRDFGFGLLNWLRYGFNAARSDMTLNADIPWQIKIHSGIVQSRLDLRSIKLRRVTTQGGVSDVELWLGQPNDFVNLDYHGGVHNLTILRPATVAARLSIHGGAANLTLDNQKYGAVGGMTVLETPNGREAAAHYVITINGGAQNVKIATL